MQGHLVQARPWLPSTLGGGTASCWWLIHMQCGCSETRHREVGNLRNARPAFDVACRSERECSSGKPQRRPHIVHYTALASCVYQPSHHQSPRDTVLGSRIPEQEAGCRPEGASLIHGEAPHPPCMRDGPRPGVVSTSGAATTGRRVCRHPNITHELLSSAIAADVYASIVCGHVYR